MYSVLVCKSERLLVVPRQSRIARVVRWMLGRDSWGWLSSMYSYTVGRATLEDGNMTLTSARATRLGR